MPRINVPFTVEIQTITQTPRVELVAGDQNYFYATFNLCETWGDVSDLKASFSRGDIKKTVPLTAGDGCLECLIPWEVMQTKGIFYVGIFGGDRILTNTAVVYVNKGCACDGSDPEPPTPDWFNAIENKYNEIAKNAKNPLKISNASAGQIVKIKTTDETGTPTEYEPADIPSGSSGGTDTSLGLTGATVGQIVKIKAVDENGVPTAWEAVEAASGEKWELINEISTTEFVTSITIDQDADGNAFSLKKMMIFMTLPITTNEAGEEQTNAGYAYYAVNGLRPAWQNPSGGWNNALFLWTIEAWGDYYTVTCYKDGGNASSLHHSDIFKKEGAFNTITKFEWRLFNGTYGWSNTHCKVYGVRA